MEAAAGGKRAYSSIVFVPTYNERLNVALIVYLIFKHLPNVNFEIIVADGGSPHGTQDIVKQLQQVYGEDRVAKETRTWYAYLHGLNHDSEEFVVIMDADLSHHPKYLPNFIRKQKETGADVVTGTRYVKNGAVHGWNLMRKLTSRGANVLAQTLLQPGASDLTGSFRRIEGLLREDGSQNYVVSVVPRYTLERGSDSPVQVFLFANSKCKCYFHNRLKPAVLTWTAMYRKQHKDIHAEAVKKRRRTTKKPYSRSIVGISLDVTQKKRAKKPEVRDAAREAALRQDLFVHLF